MSNKAAELLPKRRLEKLKATKGHINKLKDYFLDSIEEVYIESIQQYKGYEFSEKRKVTGKKALVINIFDSHFGEKIERYDRIKKQKYVSFSFKTAHRRLDNLFDRAFQEITLRGKELFDEIIIVLGGDNTEGDGTIFSYQVHELEAKIFWQIHEFCNGIMRNITRASEFMKISGSVRVVAIPGNHGERRGTSFSHPTQDNWDTALYMMVYSILVTSQMNYKDLKNVTMQFDTNTNYAEFNVKGWKFLARHIFPRNLYSTGAQRTAMALAQIFDGIDVLLTGHYHDSAMVNAGKTLIIRSGCLPGPNDYSDDLGLYGESEQAILVVSKDYRIENYIPHPLGNIN